MVDRNKKLPIKLISPKSSMKTDLAKYALYKKLRKLPATAAMIKIPPAAVPEFTNTFIFFTFFSVTIPANILRISFLNLPSTEDKIFMYELIWSAFDIHKFCRIEIFAGLIRAQIFPIFYDLFLSFVGNYAGKIGVIWIKFRRYRTIRRG